MYFTVHCDIVKTENIWKGADAIFVDDNLSIYRLGILDWSIYDCITDKYTTDEVIITKEQLMHIRTRHPEAYDNTILYIRKILDNPDYIIKDKHPGTGLVIKKFSSQTHSILLVLRICTSGDQAGYKNSIISSWQITEKRLKNYLKNKDVIYKRE